MHICLLREPDSFHHRVFPHALSSAWNVPLAPSPQPTHRAHTHLSDSIFTVISFNIPPRLASLSQSQSTNGLCFVITCMSEIIVQRLSLLIELESQDMIVIPVPRTESGIKQVFNECVLSEQTSKSSPLLL